MMSDYSSAGYFTLFFVVVVEIYHSKYKQLKLVLYSQVVQLFPLPPKVPQAHVIPVERHSQ